MTTLDTSDLNSPSRPTPDQINTTQPDTLYGILEELIYDTPNTYGWPNDYEPDFNKAKQALQAYFLEIIEGSRPEEVIAVYPDDDYDHNDGRIYVVPNYAYGHNDASDDYHTNLIKQVKGEK